PAFLPAGVAYARHALRHPRAAARRQVQLHAADFPSAARAARAPDGDIPGDRAVSADAVELVSVLAARQRVLVTGATGFVGRRLVEALASAGHEVTVLTRDRAKAALLRPPFRLVTDLEQIADDATIDVVINLAGEPISDWPWTRRKRRRILSSRLRVTR